MSFYTKVNRTIIFVFTIIRFLNEIKCDSTKNQNRRLLLSITKNCEMLIEQTQRKSERRWNLKRSNREKHFISIHLFKVKESR